VSLVSIRHQLRDHRHARWLRRAREGDGVSFGKLYHDLYQPVRHYLNCRLESPEDAEDLTSQVFHRFLERLRDYEPARGSVASWVLAIARNALIDHYRASRETVPVEELAEVLAGTAFDPLDGMIRDEEARVVQALLRELPAETREMFSLRFGQGMRYRDIAACMGLSEDAVKQRFSRALRDLRARWERHSAKGGEVDYAI
jgi:RNA polymerase sigma-70 factor (ECF subfamily)